LVEHGLKEARSFFQSGGRQICETQLAGTLSSATDQEHSNWGAWNVRSTATMAALDVRQVGQLVLRQCWGPWQPSSQQSTSGDAAAATDWSTKKTVITNATSLRMGGL